MKLAIAVVMLAACGTDPRPLPEQFKELSQCNGSDWARDPSNASKPDLSAGRLVTDSDQCEAPCVVPPLYGAQPVQGLGAPCSAHDPMYGDVECSPKSFVLSQGVSGCCITGATSGPVNFAVCQ